MSVHPIFAGRSNIMAIIFGGNGPDILNGSPDADQIFGRGGPDVISGNAGDDFLAGGAGRDTINGGLGADVILGGDGADTANGGAGGDTILGGNGADILNGDAGADFLFGGAGRDTLNGGVGSDNLRGGDGSDILNGGLGQDFLNGGQARDFFEYSNLLDSRPGASTVDHIQDFRHLVDKIDLSDLNLDRTGADRDLVYVTHAGGNTFLNVSTEGDRAPEFQIQIDGNVNLRVAADVIL